MLEKADLAFKFATVALFALLVVTTLPEVLLFLAY